MPFYICIFCGKIHWLPKIGGIETGDHVHCKKCQGVVRADDRLTLTRYIKLKIAKARKI